jgi:hypothetical protein
MGRVDVVPRVIAHADAQARLALMAAGVLIGVATWLVLDRHPRVAGAATVVGSVALIVASLRAADSTERLTRFLDSVADRAFDGALLPAIAIAMRHTDKAVSALAVVAIGTSFLAAYMRARGWALGFVVRDSLVLRSARYVALAIGLLADGLLGALIVVVAITAFTSVDDARQVSRQEA